jgi:hypothetical protein
VNVTTLGDRETPLEDDRPAGRDSHAPLTNAASRRTTKAFADGISECT